MPEPHRPPLDIAAIADGVRSLLSVVVTDDADANRSHYVEGPAKGILMARSGVGDDEAFAMLKSAFQRMGVKLRDIAAHRRRAVGVGAT